MWLLCLMNSIRLVFVLIILVRCWWFFFVLICWVILWDMLIIFIIVLVQVLWIVWLVVLNQWQWLLWWWIWQVMVRQLFCFSVLCVCSVIWLWFWGWNNVCVGCLCSFFGQQLSRVQEVGEVLRKMLLRVCWEIRLVVFLVISWYSWLVCVVLCLLCRLVVVLWQCVSIWVLVLLGMNCQSRMCLLYFVFILLRVCVCFRLVCISCLWLVGR